MPSVLSTLRKSHLQWQYCLDSLPLASDYCWGCNEYSTIAALHICDRCRVSRFCTANCMRRAWYHGDSLYPSLCELNRAHLGPIERSKLRSLRNGWGAVRSRYVSMWQAVMTVWGVWRPHFVCANELGLGLDDAEIDGLCAFARSSQLQDDQENKNIIRNNNQQH